MFHLIFKTNSRYFSKHHNQIVFIINTLRVFCEQETISKCDFPSHQTIFFFKYRPEESPYVLTAEGQIKLLNPQKYLYNYSAIRKNCSVLRRGKYGICVFRASVRITCSQMFYMPTICLFFRYLRYVLLSLCSNGCSFGCVSVAIRSTSILC